MERLATLPQLRMLAVLAQLGRARSVQVARALGWKPPPSPGWLTGWSPQATWPGEASRDTVAWSRWSDRLRLRTSPPGRSLAGARADPDLAAAPAVQPGPQPDLASASWSKLQVRGTGNISHTLVPV